MTTESQKIVNLTQHAATPSQQEAGVVEPAGKAEVQRLLTFLGRVCGRAWR